MKLSSFIFCCTILLAPYAWCEAPKPTDAEIKAILQLQQDDQSLGSKNSKVVLIEYSSAACPHCADFHKDVFPKLKAEYIDTGKMLYILRDLPTNQPSLFAAKLSHCAGKGEYFNYVKALMDSQSIWAFHNNYKDSLMNVGKLGGLSEEAINKCFNDSKMEEFLLRRGIEASRVFNIEYTPTFIINGKKKEGALTYDEFKKAIDAELISKSASK